MFWDRVACIYDLFATVYNGKTHKQLCKNINMLISSADEVLECACGTGMLTVGIAQKCKRLVATDFSAKMLKKAENKCRNLNNTQFRKADILHLDIPDQAFDKVIAANVIHLLEDPYKALHELDRVCRSGGKIIIPTYINVESNGNASPFSKIVGKAGANFKRQFTFSSYQAFFSEVGHDSVTYTMIEGRVPCAIAVIKK